MEMFIVALLWTNIYVAIYDLKSLTNNKICWLMIQEAKLSLG